MVNNKKKLKEAINKEIASVSKAETNLQKASAGEASKYKEVLRSKIPSKVLVTLEKTFSKAFSIVFDKGIAIIEKGYNKEWK